MNIEIEIMSAGISPDFKPITQRPVKPGYLVWIYYHATYESNHGPSLNEYELVIDRIWSIHGDEIEKDQFDLYAYRPESKGAIQLTDKVGNGWSVELHLYYPKDNLKSNQLTIDIF